LWWTLLQTLVVGGWVSPLHFFDFKIRVPKMIMSEISAFFKKKHFPGFLNIFNPGRVPGLIPVNIGRLGSPLPFPSQGIPQPMVDPPSNSGRGGMGVAATFLDFKMRVQKMI